MPSHVIAEDVCNWEACLRVMAGLNPACGRFSAFRGAECATDSEVVSTVNIDEDSFGWYSSKLVVLRILILEAGK
jgi:hypothetical protein